MVGLELAFHPAPTKRASLPNRNYSNLNVVIMTVSIFLKVSFILVPPSLLATTYAQIEPLHYF